MTNLKLDFNFSWYALHGGHFEASYPPAGRRLPNSHIA